MSRTILIRGARIAFLLSAISMPAYSSTESVYVVSGESTGGACPEATQAALEQAQSKASGKCADYSLLSTRYSPNLPDDSCSVTEAGQQSRTVTLRVKCSAAN